MILKVNNTKAFYNLLINNKTIRQPIVHFKNMQVHHPMIVDTIFPVTHTLIFDKCIPEFV